MPQDHNKLRTGQSRLQELGARFGRVPRIDQGRGLIQVRAGVQAKQPRPSMVERRRVHGPQDLLLVLDRPFVVKTGDLGMQVKNAPTPR